MAESVIFQLPIALLLFGAALFLCLFARNYKTGGRTITLVSTALAVIASTYGLVKGASTAETAAVLTVFLLLNMGVEE